MATYAVGDIQGCHREFVELLTVIDFVPARDRLWLTGDLVNRGPASLAVLREVIALGDRAVTVLGNHDLHLLACAFVPGVAPRRRDTLDDILAAPDRDTLLEWLRQQPLLYRDATLAMNMVHAGLPPQWTLADAQARADEVSAALRGDRFADFLAAMYGDSPDCWQAQLEGEARLRFITNCFTRLRFCDREGRLLLGEKGAPDTASPDLVPWFAAPGRASAGARIVFGHWSTLRLDARAMRDHQVYPLDTGAVWGGALTAMRLEDLNLFSVPSGETVPLH